MFSHVKASPYYRLVFTSLRFYMRSLWVNCIQVFSLMSRRSDKYENISRTKYCWSDGENVKTFNSLSSESRLPRRLQTMKNKKQTDRRTPADWWRANSAWLPTKFISPVKLTAFIATTWQKLLAFPLWPNICFLNSIYRKDVFEFLQEFSNLHTFT